MGSTRELKYITSNRGVLYYTRSIPKDVKHLDPRPDPIQKSLKTKNYDIAMSRRDALVEADDKFWRSAPRYRNDQSVKERTCHCWRQFHGPAGHREDISGPSEPAKGKGRFDAPWPFIKKQAEEIFSGPEEGMMRRFNAWLSTLPEDVAENYRMIIRNMQLIGPCSRQL